MKKYLVFLTAALLQAGAWAVTYTYTGSTYAPATVNNNTTCTTGTCGAFTSAMSHSGSFTTVAPLPANLSNFYILPLITSFSFSDGLTQYNSADPETTSMGAWADTDASGNILFISMNLIHWQASPHVIGTRFDAMYLANLTRKNSHCMGAVFPSTGYGDGCQQLGADTSTSSVTSIPAGAWAVTDLPPVASTAIPTLSEWGLLLLASLMLGAGWMAVGRRRM